MTSRAGPTPRTGGAGQFLIGPTGWTSAPGWVTHALRGGLEVSAHPELGVVHAERAGRQLVLVGYMTDPGRAELGDAGVLEALVDQVAVPADLPTATDHLVGRYLLVLITDTAAAAVGDATGGRQAYVARGPAPQTVWVASCARRLAQLLSLPLDPAASAYCNSPQFRQIRGGSWWPGTRTPYAGCTRLLPNSLVDLRGGTINRFFPSGGHDVTAVEEVRRMLRRDLRGSIHALAARQPLALLVTGGSDSRLLLAAAREVADRLILVTIRNPEGSDEDVEIPARFSADLGLDHRVVTAEAPGAELLRLYREQDGPGNLGYAANAGALLPVTHDRVAITGHVAGAFKRSLGGARFARRATATRLALETHMGSDPFAVEAWREWLETVPATGFPTHDLAYWENRVGSWVAGWSLEYDVAWQDVLWPMASRRLLRALPALTAAHGVCVQRSLWQQAIQDWWPELAEYELGGNPEARRSVRSRAGRTLRYIRART